MPCTTYFGVLGRAVWRESGRPQDAETLPLEADSHAAISGCQRIGTSTVTHWTASPHRLPSLPASTGLTCPQPPPSGNGLEGCRCSSLQNVTRSAGVAPIARTRVRLAEIFFTQSGAASLIGNTSHDYLRTLTLQHIPGHFLHHQHRRASRLTDTAPSGLSYFILLGYSASLLSTLDFTRVSQTLTAPAANKDNVL